MKPHAFVVMPFGVKKDSQGTEIDFNRAGLAARVCVIFLLLRAETSTS